MRPMIFNATVYDVRIKRNGGRITLDFGVDSLAVVQEIASIGALGDQNFQFAVVQMGAQEPDPNEVALDVDHHGDVETVDF